MAEMAERIARLRERASRLPADSGARIEALDRCSDAEAALDSIGRLLDRAELALDVDLDSGDRVVGGWTIERG